MTVSWQNRGMQGKGAQTNMEEKIQRGLRGGERAPRGVGIWGCSKGWEVAVALTELSWRTRFRFP